MRSENFRNDWLNTPWARSVNDALFELKIGRGSRDTDGEIPWARACFLKSASHVSKLPALRQVAASVGPM